MEYLNWIRLLTIIELYWSKDYIPVKKKKEFFYYFKCQATFHVDLNDECMYCYSSLLNFSCSYQIEVRIHVHAFFGMQREKYANVGYVVSSQIWISSKSLLFHAHRSSISAIVSLWMSIYFCFMLLNFSHLKIPANECENEGIVCDSVWYEL